MRIPIKLRLTLAFAVSIAMLLGVAGTFLYLRLAAELRGSTDAGLRAQADVIAAGIGEQGIAFGDTTGAAIQEGQPFAQVLDASGAIQESSEPIAGSPLVASPVLGSLAGPTFLSRDVPGVEGTSRLFVLPVTESGQRIFVVVGSSLSNRDEILSRFLLILAIGGPIAVALASAAGWFISGAAFRPVERMRREAAAISDSDRGRRLPVPQTGDEVARLGATLNSMLDRLQAAFDRERRFVDDASHELRTPLTILKAELELALSRARTPAELEAAIRSATEETDRLVALADDLLVYSRSDGGRVPVHRSPVRLDELLREVAASVQGRADPAGVSIEVRGTPTTASVDAIRVRQAIDNLVENALRHTPPGGRVRLSVAGNGDPFTLMVEDSGVGVEPGFVEAAFEPFARGSADRAAAYPGAGLGLAIVQAVAHAHGGHATAENIPDGGARVTLVLHSAG